MFPLRPPRLPAWPRFPRMRGDVPHLGFSQYRLVPFSPRARGCSSLPVAGLKPPTVFPACAGMFLYKLPMLPLPSGFPRVRGDVPGLRNLTNHRNEFSPRERGCSCGSALPPAQMVVFPACAGMFLRALVAVLGPDGFPRVRGDVPR